MNPWTPLLPLAFVAAVVVAATAEPQATGQDSASSAAALDPLFDCYRANSAWGLTYSGKVMNRNGQVWSYSARGKALPVPHKESGLTWYKAADLIAKYAGSTPAERLEAGALAEHAALIEKAAAGNVASTDTGVRDAGTSTCHAYLFDAAGKRYRDVELGSDGGVGDQRISNDATEAQTLLQWLRASAVAR
jgi:hypothetical protein